MNNNIKYFALVLLLAFLAWLVIDLFSDIRGPSKTNPYKLDTYEINKVDETMLSHQLVKRFPISAENVKALDGFGSKLYVGADSTLFELQANTTYSDFSITAKVVLPELITSITAHASAVYLSSANKVYKVCDGTPELLFGISENAMITGIAKHDQYFFITDAGNKLVFKYDEEGNMKQKIEDKNKGRPGFIIPSGYFDILASDSGFWVVNPGMHKLVQFNDVGEYVSDWGKASMGIEGFCGCCNPNHFTRSNDGNFVTTEKGISRVKIYDSQGKLISVVASPKDFPDGTILQGVYTPDNNTVIVLEDMNKSVTVFKQTSKIRMH